MAQEKAVDVDAFWEDGYTIVRNVYSKDEIQAMREAVFASKDNGPADLLSNPKMRSVLTDGNMVRHRLEDPRQHRYLVQR